ncbi:hypothetical protein WH52_00605 [Tenacibaculum holothuriorum]|uniref:N-acetyltransferase domain-containing protein n=1 Tax=Tenacibaculum holothuriorum TaxID=1635173 RepID=A0A1Y2PGA6_9FLAO|nr:GNAT family N-acetyltransferase [Tenacibaculum holothuriorum]OSY89190.1 hypothetical protein WH52_00605 [Tenacibaculum holothuriorum]
MIKIKIATHKDVEILALLGRVTYSESHGHFINNAEDLYNYNNEAFSIQRTTEELYKKENIYWIAYLNNFPVGYAKLVLNADNDSISDQNICRLERIYVLNEFLGKKVGYQLYNTVLDKAKELKFNQIWLTVYIKNYKAIKFYEKQDFKKVGDYTFWVNGKAFENYIHSKPIS